MISKVLSKIILVSLIAIPVAIEAQEPGPPPPAPDYSPNTWKEFVSSEGGFRVRFPGAPTEETEVKPGNILLHSLTYGSERFIFYAVNYRDLASEKDANDYLKGVRELRLLGMEGKMKLLSEKKRSVTGNQRCYSTLS